MSSDTLHRLAELRQEAWRNLGSYHHAWPRDAELARALTRELNGHADDLTRTPSYKSRKRAYAIGHGGIYAERRRDRFLARPSGVHPDGDPWIRDPLDGSRLDLAQLMASNGHVRSGGRLRGSIGDLSGHRDEEEVLEVVGKWHDLGSPEAAEFLMEGDGPEMGHVESKSKLAGGDHDRVWLLYHGLRPAYPLEEHRAALTRRGRRLPARLVLIKRDAERLVEALLVLGVSKAEVARLFACSPRTIARVEQRLNVYVSSYKGRGAFVQQPATQRDLDRLVEARLAATLARIDVAVQRIAERHADDERVQEAARAWFERDDLPLAA